MVTKEELDNMILTDLVAECETRGIPVDVSEDADALRAKLAKLAKKPKAAASPEPEPTEPPEPPEE